MNFLSAPPWTPHLRRITIAAVTGLVLTSCTRPVIKLADLPFKCPTTIGTLQAEDDRKPLPLDLSVYIDGSGSMLGYVPQSKPDETEYSRMLEVLHNLFVDHQDPLKESYADLPQPRVQYFRMGLNKETEKSLESFNFKSPGSLDPRFKPFYEAEVTSQLQSGISPPSSGQDKLSVLISDLDQDNSAIQKVTQAIQQNYLKQDKPNYSVALLGIMNDFNGNVYSTDPQKISTFSYNQPRPVYLVWIGTNDRLAFYLEKFTNKLKQQKLTYNLSIFSPQGLTQGFALVPDPNLTLPNGISRQSFVLDNAEVILEKQNALAEFLVLQSRAIESPQSIPYTTTVNPPDTFSSLQGFVVDVAQLQTESQQVKSWQFNTQSKKFEVSPIPSLGLKLEKISQNKNSLSFEAIIDPTPLNSKTIYPYRFEAVAAELETHEWWQEWDWDNRAKKEDGSLNNEDGSKTYQLLRFAESLQTLTLKALPNNSTIGTFCFAVQKN